MLNSKILYLNNSHVLQLLGLKNGLDNAFSSSAVVTATLKDSKGNNVPGQTWPLTLNYVADSDGSYNAVLNAGLGLVKNKQYHLKITAVDNGLTATWDDYIKAEVRQ